MADEDGEFSREFYAPLVDGESLHDPRAIRGLWETFEHFTEEGKSTEALRVAEELARAWDAGENIFDQKPGGK